VTPATPELKELQMTVYSPPGSPALLILKVRAGDRYAPEAMHPPSTVVEQV
jgi:hypothetical protein